MAEDDVFDNMELPVVTVFGAGIAGLSAAHELAERGFQVQVVEPSLSPTVEYECSVGGLAANQFSRVRAPIPLLHPWLLHADQKTNLAHALGFRDFAADIELSGKRYPLNQKLRFDRRLHRPADLPDPAPAPFDPSIRSRREPDKAAPAKWVEYWDAQGVLNAEKLEEAFATIRAASSHYMRQFFPDLAVELEKDPKFKPKDWSKYSKIHDTPANAHRFIARETFFVRIVGYTDTDSTQEQNRSLAKYWADEVHDWLLKRNSDRFNAVTAAAAKANDFIDQPIWQLRDRLEVVVRGSAGARDSADPRTRSLANRVEFEVVEQIIPGEHGFRFFPGFYRHLFDTMRRTPCFDVKGELQGSAYEQLVPTPHAQLALKGGLYDFDFRKVTSMSQVGRELNLYLGKIGFKTSDFLGLTVRTLRFMTSGPKRREVECEPINLMEYMGGKKPEQFFSQACIDFVDRAPRALAAMSARESDARSQYSITIQLALPDLPDPMTLNGPTSMSWLDPWKRYLKRLGVKFFVGSLEDVAPMTWSGETTPRLVPVTIGTTRKPHPDSPAAADDPTNPWPENPDDRYKRPEKKEGVQHRFVLAAQFGKASDIAWKARAQAEKLKGTFQGPFAQLVAFDENCGRRQPGDAQAQLAPRDPITGKEVATWPSRTISGMQFFFPQAYRFGRSNVYFSYTPYALTSISQYAFWRQHSQPVGQLLGQISIDLGDWHAAYPEADPAKPQAAGPTAYYSSSKELAQGTWEQVLSGLPGAYADVVKKPRYYHLDQNMVFRDTYKSTDAAMPGWTLVGAVRANAILRVPQNVHRGASLALVAGRYYGVKLRVGAAGELISAGPVQQTSAAAATLRDTLFDALEAQAHGKLILAKADGADIVASPIAKLTTATLRVLGPSAETFLIVLDGRKIPVTLKDRGAVGVVDALAGAIVQHAGDLVSLTRPAPEYLTLTPLKGETINVGVLNVERKIELIGAPTLIVEAFNLEVPEPDEGFALVRNNYEYVIDIPGQWSYRAGLRRDPGGMPTDFVKLSQTFGTQRPEIYYGHPETCPLLEYWVGAGAHMATYTRMTTMEAANESGRHAAAALIYDLHTLAKRRNEAHYIALAGDFPTIYPVEDHENEDFDIFKKLDDQLFEMGQPHLFEVIGLTQMTEAILLGNFAKSEIQAKLAPILAGLPGLQLSAPAFTKKLSAMLSKLLPDPVGRWP